MLPVKSQNTRSQASLSNHGRRKPDIPVKIPEILIPLARDLFHEELIGYILFGKLLLQEVPDHHGAFHHTLFLRAVFIQIL